MLLYKNAFRDLLYLGGYMKNILIIEDDIAIAEIERDYLEINGFEVKIETDGVSGMNTALKGGFQLVLLDLMLPEMSELAGTSGYTYSYGNSQKRRY